MTGEHLASALVAAGVRHATGVPCSYFGSFYAAAAARGAPAYVAAPHEGLAVSLAAGWALAGELPCVLMQNSGLGNAVNPLTSLVVPYRLPMVLFVSGRAFRTADEPQHRLMGEHLEGFLEACGTRWSVCPAEPAALAAAVQDAVDQARRAQGPHAVIIPKGTFDKHVLPAPKAPGRPTRREVLVQLAPRLGERVVVSSTGFTSRDLYAVADRARNFYMQGSMGHASSIGLGLAQRGCRVVVLDGDGAALMHLGAMAMIGQHPSAPLCHLVFDNGVHESTGNQRVAAAPVDFAAVARAVGYREVRRVEAAGDVAAALEAALAVDGPSCLVIGVRVEGEGSPAPRITEGLEHHEVARRLRESLGGDGAGLPVRSGER